MLTPRSLFPLPAAGLALLLTGCGAHNFQGVTSPIPASIHAIHGRTMGGQQPVSGATVYLYFASTQGYAGTPSGGTTATTSTTGAFDFGNISCSDGTLQTYLVARGGDAGFGTNNNLVLMAALGPCSGVAAIPTVTLNEVTTVAAAYALSGFIQGANQLGAPSTNLTGLAQAFADNSQLVDITTGLPSGPTLPTGATLPVYEMNTLADALAACVNSTGGSAGDGTTDCGTIFTAATPPSGAAPTDTLTAMVNIVHFPYQNIAAITMLAKPASPFQPTLSGPPNDLTLAVNYAPPSGTAPNNFALTNPSSLAIDSTGNVWITNKIATGSGTSPAAVKFSHAGVGIYEAYTGALPTAIAVDAADGVEFTNAGSNAVRKLTSTGATQTTTTVATPPASGVGGLNAPASIAVDTLGDFWIANPGNSSLTELNASLGAISPAAGFTGVGIVNPVAIAISLK